MASTEVEVRDNRGLRRVEALTDDGEVAGFSQYRISADGGTFDFTHTEVDDRFEGMGVGSRLAAGVLEIVRREGARIKPSCSFIRSYIERHEDSRDLLADGVSLGEKRS
jgi:predicted GNAT family acetyltransferase